MYWASTFLATISVVLIITFLCKLFIKRRQFVRLIEKLPGPPTLPLFGNTAELISSPASHERIFLNHTAKWPRLFRFWVGSTAVVCLHHPETVEAVLSSTVDISKSDLYTFLHPWLGTGLLNSDDEKWKIRRKLLTPAFHFCILQDFIGVFNEQSNILVDNLWKQFGKQINIFPVITNCTLDIICESAMGRHINAQGNFASDYVKATDRIKDIIHSRQIYPWLQPDWLFKLTKPGRDHSWCLKVLHSFTEKVISEKKAQWKPRDKDLLEDIVDESVPVGQKKRLAFLDLLLDVSDGGRVLSDSDIREEVDTFMFEGHDTTAAAISWAIYLLGIHPEIQEKVHSELDEIFGLDRRRPVTAEDISKMNYLELVIKETLRIYPSVPLFARLLKRGIDIDGYTIPTGTTIAILAYALHRNPDIYPEPLEFDPDRFLPDNCSSRHPYAYIPFSAGPRNCIGQKFAILEEKVVLSYILRSFQVRSIEPRDKIQVVAELILKSVSGINVTLTPRA